ncbi:MAG: argininosuccinate lyase, partial [Spirochaetales bacterium]|nr:argininosuccinate lyase [Spirochaetales bacterium]MCF7939767.1 argininosuccinate lyase [Spirochaetales bacterium]
MAKLWQKSYQLDSNIERFTVGDDYLLDRKLVSADCLGSIAHARMLASIGLLSQEEEKNLVSELRRIISGEDSLSIEAEDEDVHTAIENRLTERLGEAGRKIHTGRSRNDQVLTAMRLYTKAAGYRLRHSLIDLSSALLSLAEGHEFLPLPGRTHLQIAMPSSAGLWASAYAEQLLDDAHLLESALELVDRCPLGSAASYGVPLPLDREMTAGLLGFSGPHHNVLAAQNSRGKLEAAVLDALDQAGITINRLAQDLILFSLPELGYISLPDELCSGSSIMPQKKNPDVLELSRARAAVLSAEAGKIKQIVRGLPSGYQR